ncbi:MAG TPA: hypothetical protein VGB85_20870 [Nannocystis sp.]|jgi:hypothetical protein
MAPPLLPNLLPATRLIACSACAQHVKSNESSCPHCGAELRGSESRALRAAGAVLLGLALSGCADKEPDTASDSEGMTGTSGTSGATDATGSDTGATGTGSDSSGDTSTGGPEPEYGVPMTTSEPDYGVPSTDPTTGDTDASTGDTASDTSSGSGEPLYGAGAT